MKRYVYRGGSGQWYTFVGPQRRGDFAMWELILMAPASSFTQHDTWQEAFGAAFTMVTKVRTNS